MFFLQFCFVFFNMTILALLKSTPAQGQDYVSTKYSEEIKQMVQSGNFGASFDKKPGSNLTRHDKKELSVWKLLDNVAKLDFRHWLDTVDIQLEAIHGFQFPDLVLEKIKRLPNVVTKESLHQIIIGINDDHREKKRKEHIEKTGSPSASRVQTHGIKWPRPAPMILLIKIPGISTRIRGGCSLT